jgi:hypothetical protein
MPTLHLSWLPLWTKVSRQGWFVLTKSCISWLSAISWVIPVAPRPPPRPWPIPEVPNMQPVASTSSLPDSVASTGPGRRPARDWQLTLQRDGPSITRMRVGGRVPSVLPHWLQFCAEFHSSGIECNLLWHAPHWLVPLCASLPPHFPVSQGPLPNQLLAPKSSAQNMPGDWGGNTHLLAGI